jgi:endonuclease III
MQDDSHFSSRLDKLFDRISDINATLAAQHETLKEHIRRTELLEERLEPIEKQVTLVTGGMKALRGIVALVTILAAVLEIIHFLK